MKRFTPLLAGLVGALLMVPAAAVETQPANGKRDLFTQRLTESTLGEKRRLLREWAIGVLPEIGAIATTAAPEFAGVRNTGRLILRLDYSQPVDVQRELFATEDYWRGVMEMSRGNHLIAELPVFLHIANGEWDRAGRAAQILSLYTLPDSLAGRNLAEAKAYLTTCIGAKDREIQRGIALHDQGRYAEAKQVYQGILDAGIRSAWARYELFYSTAHEGGRQHLFAIGSGKEPGEWDEAAREIYAFDPLYGSQFVGSRGKTMGALQARVQLSQLNQKKSKSMGEFLSSYADLALKLEAYSTAAQLYWTMLGVKELEPSVDEILARYLYSLEKMGVTGLKANFKGPFEDKFKQLEADLDKYRKM